MTTKTLDLNALFPTFESTYAHARRMGADRPLAQRFGLADVLGEIETEIATRIDAVKAEAEKAAADARVEWASGLAAERARTSALLATTRSSSTPVPAVLGPVSDTVTSFPRYRAEGRGVRDLATGELAPFPPEVAPDNAQRLNAGTLRRSEVPIWRTVAEQKARAASTFAESARHLASVSSVPSSTITADRLRGSSIESPRFTATTDRRGNAVVRDRLTGQHAPFLFAGLAHEAARAFNRGDRSPSVFAWRAPLPAYPVPMTRSARPFPFL
jgi:hypothetical protein